MIKKQLFLCILAITIQVFGQTETKNQDSLILIKGIVLERNTNETVENAQIQIKDSNLDIVGYLTDINGSFEISLNRNSEYSLEVYKDDFINYSNIISIIV